MATASSWGWYLIGLSLEVYNSFLGRLRNGRLSKFEVQEKKSRLS